MDIMARNCVYFVVLIVIWNAHFSVDASNIDCSFENDDTPARCGYRNGWYEMMKGNWKLVKTSRDGKIKDTAGYFAYVEARRRPKNFASRFVSEIGRFHEDDCVSFSYVNKGTRKPYPNGRMKLEVYFSTGGRDIKKSDQPIWSSTTRTGRNRWKEAEVHIGKHASDESLVGAVAFVAVRGGSKRAYIAVDNVSVSKCKDSARPRNSTVYYALAARRPVHTRDFSIGPHVAGDAGSSVPSSLAAFTAPPIIRTHGRHRSHRRRKKKKNKRKEIGVVYLNGDDVVSESSEPFVPTRVGQERPHTACDFLKYTQELRRCLRAFFSMLRRHKSKRKCNSDFYLLETCLKQVAASCVPSSDMPREIVHEIVTDTLRTKFKTQQVYCLEEGAFVYPEFSLGSIPLQCSRVYFGKLTSCGGAFSGIFNFKHGDPSLCREYFQANECQRQATAEECEFDTRSKLIYGLNLQYQFAHNPFCIDLPFSAWWPDQ